MSTAEIAADIAESGDVLLAWAAAYAALEAEAAAIAPVRNPCLLADSLAPFACAPAKSVAASISLFGNLMQARAAKLARSMVNKMARLCHNDR